MFNNKNLNIIISKKNKYFICILLCYKWNNTIKENYKNLKIVYTYGLCVKIWKTFFHKNVVLFVFNSIGKPTRKKNICMSSILKYYSFSISNIVHKLMSIEYIFCIVFIMSYELDNDFELWSILILVLFIIPNAYTYYTSIHELFIFIIVVGQWPNE